MKLVVNWLIKLGILKKDLDYRVAFLMKGIVLLATSIYLLKQNVARSGLTKSTSIEHDKEALLSVSRSPA